MVWLIFFNMAKVAKDMSLYELKADGVFKLTFLLQKMISMGSELDMVQCRAWCRYIDIVMVIVQRRV